jgi:peptide/nickel transport system substrate-binding protein
MKRNLLAALCLFLVAGGMAVLAAGPKDGGVVVFGKPKDARVLDPGICDEGNSSMVITNMFQPLITFKPGTSEFMPCLAAEMPTVSKDHKEITFKLRQGVKFHDGTTMDADAVVFSLKRQFDKSSPFNKFGPWNYWSGKGWSDTDKKQGIVKDVVKVDNSTVKVLLNVPDQSIMYNFALYFTDIVSPTAVQKWGADFKSHPVGTGPFQFVEWIKDDHVALKRFDGYWGEKAHLDSVIFKVFPDEQARIAALQTGEADIIDPTGPEGMKTIEADPNLKLVPGDRLNMGYLCMQCQKGPFTNKKVRQALCFAVDRKTIMENVYGKTGVPEKLPMPSILWGYDKKLPDYTYDPAKARALLKEAGVPLPVKVEFLYLPAWRPYIPNGKRLAEIVQAQLNAVGFDVEIKTFEMGTYWDKLDEGAFDLCENGWTGEGDPDDWLFNLLTEGYNNNGKWLNKEYIDLVTNAKFPGTIAERAKLYYKAEKVMMDDYPILTIARGIEFRPMNKKIEGYKIYPDGFVWMASVWINK